MTIGNPTYTDLFICAPCRNADHELCPKWIRTYNKNSMGYSREVLGTTTIFAFTGCACPCKRVEVKPNNPSGI